MSTGTWARLAGAAILLLALAAGLYFVPWSDAEAMERLLEETRKQVDRFGYWGPVILIGLFVVATLLMLPSSLLTLLSGMIYGPILGLLVIMSATIVGSSLAFLVGRTLLRSRIERFAAKRPRFRALDRAIAERGLRIVILLRLTPIAPFNVLNYALSLTKVRLRQYMLGTLLGMLPGTALFVYLGSTAREVAQLVSGEQAWGSGATLLFFGGLLVTAGLTIYLTFVARRALQAAMDQYPDD